MTGGRNQQKARQKASSEQRKPKERRRPVISAKLPSGELVETLYDGEKPSTRFLVAWSDEEVAELNKVPVANGGWLVPYSPDNNLLTHKVVLLPSALGAYRSTQALTESIRTFIHRYVDLTAGFEELATHYVLLTWRYDRFNELPYLRVLGEYGSGKSRFLQTVGSLCYKPIFASGASSVSPLFRLLDAVEGTLVIDEADFRASDERAEVVKILNNGNARGFPVLRSEATPTGEYNPRAFSVFGPKLVATRHRFEDKALESRCITEVMGGRVLRKDIPLNLPHAFHTEAQELRNALLRYRIGNARKTEALDPPPADLEPRIAQVFAPLAATAASAEAKQRLWALARRYSRTLRLDRSEGVEGQLISVMQTLRGRGERLTASAIAIALQREHPERYGGVSPRFVGAILRKRLNITPVRSHGVYTVSTAAFPRLDELAEWYGVDMGDVGDEAEGTLSRDAA